MAKKKLRLTEDEKAQIYESIEEQVYRDDVEQGGFEEVKKYESTDEGVLDEMIDDQYKAVIDGEYGDRKELIELEFFKPKPKKPKGAKLI